MGNGDIGHNMRSLSRLSPFVSLYRLSGRLRRIHGQVRRVLPHARLLKIVQRGKKWDVATPSGSYVGDYIYNRHGLRDERDRNWEFGLSASRVDRPTGLRCPGWTVWSRDESAAQDQLAVYEAPIKILLACAIPPSLL